MRDPVTIRAHHLLCVQGFQGYGYSSEFVVSLAALVGRLRENPDTLLEIVGGTDAMCAKCPHRDGDFCRKDPGADGRMRGIDARVLDKLGWPVGKNGKAGDIFIAVNARLTAKKDVTDICGGCSWRETCSWHSSLRDDESEA